MKLSIIIPCYNEAATIATIIERVVAVDFYPYSVEVIAVNDGSIDSTAAVLDTLTSDMTVINHDNNRGKAAAIRSGLAVAKGQYTVIQDGDLEYNPQDIRTLLAHAVHHNLVSVYGSRNLGHTNRGRADYYWGGRLVTIFCNILYGSSLSDEATCYKLVRTDVLHSMHLQEEGFDFCPEVTAKLLRQGNTIVELPITYNPRAVAEGKKIRYHDGLRALWVLLKYRIISSARW
jgi:glycosyltransferase involved in cell wall biosynthesis